jgi:hypothetical protein
MLKQLLYAALRLESLLQASTRRQLGPTRDHHRAREPCRIQFSAPHDGQRSRYSPLPSSEFGNHATSRKPSSFSGQRRFPRAPSATCRAARIQAERLNSGPFPVLRFDHATRSQPNHALMPRRGRPQALRRSTTAFALDRFKQGARRRGRPRARTPQHRPVRHTR